MINNIVTERMIFVTKEEFTSNGEDTNKIRIGTFSHSSGIHDIASKINEKVFNLSNKN